MVLDENLSWKSHVKYIISKAGKKIGLFGRVREDLTTNAANLIYKTFILPVMDYCDSVWACCNRTDIDLLERLQNRAGRIVMKSSRSAPALANLKWNSLESRRNKHILKLVYKCLAKKAPQFSMIILFIIEKLFLGSRDKVIHCTCPKLELKLVKDHSCIMVVQYVIIILVVIMCNYNVYFCFCFCYSFSYLNAICYLM